MTTVAIDPAVHQQESNDMLRYLKERNLLLAQALHDVRAELADVSAQLAEVQAAAKELQATAEEIVADQKEGG